MANESQWWHRFEFEIVNICVPAARNGEHKAAERVLQYICECAKTGVSLHPAVLDYLADAFGQALKSENPADSIVACLNLKRPGHRPAMTDERDLKIYKAIEKRRKAGKKLHEAVHDVASSHKFRTPGADNVMRIYKRLRKIFKESP